MTKPTVNKKQNEISALPRLSKELMENIFNVYQDKNTNRYFYNILQRVVFPTNLAPSFFDTYVVEYKDTWPLISFKHYQTPNLWWLILLANKIQNPIKFPEVGTQILVPNTNTASEVLQAINI